MTDDNATGAHAEIEQELEAKRRTRKRGITIVVAIAIVAVVAIVTPLVWNAFAGSGGQADDELIPLTIGDTAQSNFQDSVVEVGRENGLDINFVNFDDPYLPNTALLEGEVDANTFQHVAWLSQFNKENNADIAPVFSTVVTTWGLFSDQYASVDEIAEGSRIAVPDDPANFSRSLFILQSAGLLTLDEGAGVFPTEEDITANDLNLEFVRIAHESVQSAYEDPSIAGVVIAVDDFDPALGITSESALAVEDSTSADASPYVLVLAVRGDDTDNPAWPLLEQTYRDARVIEALEEEKRGEATIVEIPVEELNSTLTELTEQ